MNRTFCETYGPYPTITHAHEAMREHFYNQYLHQPSVRWIQKDQYSGKYWITGPLLSSDEVTALIEASEQETKTRTPQPESKH